MNAASANRKFANTLARGMAVMRAFRASDSGLTHAQIADRTGLPKPTVSRLTYTLCALGYLSYGGRNDRFRLGPSAIALGSVASAAVDFLDLASEPMQNLADQTGVLTLVAVRDDSRMMLVRTWRSQKTSTIWLEPGHRIPVRGSSSGLAVVASLGQERFDQLTPDADMRQFRSEGCAQLVRHGFAYAVEGARYDSTINAVSVPYFAEEFGESVAFTAGAMPEDLTDTRIRSEVGPALRDLVRALEQRTGRMPALSRRD